MQEKINGNSQIVDKLLKFIELKSISPNQFHKEIGVGNGYLKKVKSIGSEIIESIGEKYPDLNIDWLITGRGEMLNKEALNIVAEPNIEYGTQNKSGIPLVNVTAVGGFGNSKFAISERDVKEYYVIPKFKHKKIDFMIEVEGSSMYPKYNSGDIVACRIISEASFIQWNKTHVIATREQGIIIKRIKQGLTDQSLLIISDNKEYPEFEVPKKEIEGIALVVGVIRLE